MTLSQKQIEDVLANILSNVSENSPDTFDATLPLDSYGLDSVARVGLLSELERRIDLDISIDELISCETPQDIASAIVSKSDKQ